MDKVLEFMTRLEVLIPSVIALISALTVFIVKIIKAIKGKKIE